MGFRTRRYVGGVLGHTPKNPRTKHTEQALGLRAITPAVRSVGHESIGALFLFH